MKKHIIILFLIVPINFLFSQEINFTGKIEYKMTVAINRPIEYKSELFFNNTHSLFVYTEVLQENVEEIDDSNNLNFNIILKDSLAKEIFINKSNDSLYEKHKNLISKNSYYSVERVPKIKWNITNQTKKIKDIECYLAKTTFRGRNYLVWFAPSLVNPVGPWKFNGLPGIILEAYDDKREVTFYVNRITIPYHFTNKPLNQELSVLSLNEHLHIMNNIDSEIGKKIQSKFGRGIQVKVETKISTIELNFND
ncbi:GLPGLI family protein [Oceanihabitans sediminis]|uniref:GLPGLI family protein n=1 Tax=Oceanihabitans sediminis TaxID=1812012 RepID=A0A368PAL5_9FLAO|nr:GLPGLI family protein [Oceanihabitans sediminis]RBP34613.1 GLPGLI family protein [Oceanihabitans sediminis]RCU58271.1 GLPGLI family protein [Oceanihabitans sediminis]